MESRTLELGCRCGEIEGRLTFGRPSTCNHLVCYCSDCQRFARHVGDGPWLDAHGGTTIVQVTPRQVVIARGAEHLRSLRLSAKGTLRWYTGCCRVPVANTASAGLPFAGLISTFIKGENKAAVIGPVRQRVQGRDAIDPPADLEIHPAFPRLMVLGLMGRMLVDRVRGFHRPNPFFDETGRPIVRPTVLDAG